MLLLLFTPVHQILILVRFGLDCTELLIVDDGMGQEGRDQMMSFVLGNGSNQNRTPGDTSRFVYSNKGLGRQAVMVRRYGTSLVWPSQQH